MIVVPVVGAVAVFQFLHQYGGLAVHEENQGEGIGDQVAAPSVIGHGVHMVTEPVDAADNGPPTDEAEALQTEQFVAVGLDHVRRVNLEEMVSTSIPMPFARLTLRCNSIICSGLEATRKLPVWLNNPNSLYSSMLYLRICINAWVVAN